MPLGGMQRRPAVVDLYGFRCAVAVLIHARDNIVTLDNAQIARVDVAIQHLSEAVPGLAGELGSATAALLSQDADPGGRRTVRAVGRLGHLTHVDEATAPALAASIRRREPPSQLSLFDPDPNVTTST